MFKCECGHHRCRKLVSRSTWFRHKLAGVLQGQVDQEHSRIEDPLPVEAAPPQEEDEEDEAGPPEEDEVSGNLQI
jgi:hypothetical protein